jgi:hypothetical protein
MLLSALIRSRKNATSTMVNRLFYTSTGQIIVSAIFGVALALLFQKACKGRKCLIITAPPQKDLEKYKNGEECYKYTPRYLECQAEAEADDA